MQAVNGRIDSSAPEPAPAAAVVSENYAWILNPVIDIMFACGGMMWVLWFVVEKLGVTRTIGTTHGTILWITWLIGVHFFANDHAFIGWHRVATSKYVSQEVRTKLGWFAVFCFLMLFPVILIPGWAAVAAKVYVLWLVQHYGAQAYGVTMIYCLKRNYRMTKFEKDSMHWMFRLLMIMVIAKTLTYKEFSGDFFEGLKLPFWGPLPEWMYLSVVYAFIASVVLFSGIVLNKYVKDKQLFPFPALLNTASIIGIYLVSQSAAEPVLSVMMAAFFHGTQNIVVGMACHLKERGLPENVPNSKIASQLLKPYTLLYYTGIVIMGVLLMVVLPRLLMVLSQPLQITIAAVFALQGYHHFITESVVWRLRHPDIRKILIA